MADGRGLDTLVNTLGFCFGPVVVPCFGLQFSQTHFTWLQPIGGMAEELVNHKMTIYNSLF